MNHFPFDVLSANGLVLENVAPKDIMTITAAYTADLVSFIGVSLAAGS